MLNLALLEICKLNSSSLKAEQPENIFSMLVAWEVVKLDTSRVVREEQPENRLSKLNIWDVLKLDKSRVVSEEQPENM